MFQIRISHRAAQTAMLCLILFTFGRTALPLHAAGDDPAEADPFAPPTVSVRLEVLADPLVAGATVPLALIYSVPPETHLTETFFFVEFSSDPPLEFSEPVFPPHVLHKGEKVYRGEVPVWTRVTLPYGEVSFTAKAEYQICAEGETEMCFPPDEANPVLHVAPVKAGADWRLRELAGLDADDLGGASSAAFDSESLYEESGDLAGRLEKALSRGSWFAFLMVFLGGVLASLTPCVYPVIPMTIAYIGGSAKGNPFKGFIISLWFVLGIAITYSVLGLLAAAGGGAFGQATQNAWVNGGIALLIGAMGMSMAGFFDIQLPSSFTSKIGGARSGFLGPILMGFATGLIAAPCVGPVLIVLLSWVAQSGNLFMGFWLLFTFACGLGLLFIVLGTFSGAITALPGAGVWMDHVKHFFAIVLFGLALWFLRSIAPGWLLITVFGIILSLGVGTWGAFRHLPEDASHKQALIKSFLLLLWVLGAVLAISAGLKGLAPGILPAGSGEAAGTHAALQEPEWIWDDEAGFAEATDLGQPLMMDFWAEWCGACKELDHKTYSKPEILALAERFTCVKMDMTKKNDENSALLEKYTVRGMPTVIFFDADGEEIERFVGYKNVEYLARIMNKILAL